MIKAELVKKITQETSLKKKQVEAVLDALWQTVTETLHKGEKLKLAGLLTLGVKQTVARIAIHPITKQPISVPATTKVYFKAGKKLKAAINISPDNR